MKYSSESMSTFRHTSAGTKSSRLTMLFSQLPAAHFDALSSVPLEKAPLPTTAPHQLLSPQLCKQHLASCPASPPSRGSFWPPHSLPALRGPWLSQSSCSSTTAASPCPARQLVLVPGGSCLVLQLRGRVAALISRFLSNLCRILPDRPGGAVRLQKLHYSQAHLTASAFLAI